MAIEMKAFFAPVVPECPWKDTSQVAEVWIMAGSKVDVLVADVFRSGASDSDHQRMAEVLAASTTFFKVLHDLLPRLEGEDRERVASALALVRPHDPEDTSHIDRMEATDRLIAEMGVRL